LDYTESSSSVVYEADHYYYMAAAVVVDIHATLAVLLVNVPMSGRSRWTVDGTSPMGLLAGGVGIDEVVC
jgi:hypothetical protein